MSDDAIPEVEAEATSVAANGGGRVPAGGPIDSAPPSEPVDAVEVSRDCLRTLLESAVTHRSVDEVADLVKRWRSGQVPDAANEALQAAAVSRPIEDVISLAELLAADQPQHEAPPSASQEVETQPQPPTEPQPDSDPPAQQSPATDPDPDPEPETVPDPVRRAEQERPSASHGSRGSRRPVARRPREVAQDRVPASAPDRGLRWLVAATLIVSALLYLPRHPSRLLADAGMTAWLLLGLAGGCVSLSVMVARRDRAGVWAATTATGFGLVLMHALATATELKLWASATGALLPWPTGAAMFTAGLTAVLSVLALLYRSDRPQPAPGPDQPATASNPLDAPPAPATRPRVGPHP
ncbi:hypothetical protein [Streptomyces subrutilus]|uniref:hypothetical protein n=1 Tax=Streptomyces subrutilus TaxID=36818 RepID=UPI0033C48852